MKIALVTGSRNWTDGVLVRSVLNDFGAQLVIHGDCPAGADQIADEWAVSNRFPALRLPAQWDKLGRSAGMARNADLVAVAALLAKYGHDVRVFAFPLPDSRGTPDCVRKAKAAGLTVTEFKGWKR